MSHIKITYTGAAFAYNVPPTMVSIPQRAELGETSQGGFSPEDPTAALTLVGHRPIVIEELDCSQPRLFTGWTVERNMGRSFEQTQLAGPDALVHDTSIEDLNAALRFRIITWTDGKRPEESVDARLAWLLASNYVAGPDGTLFENTGKVQTGFSLLMDACDYREYYAADVLADLSTRYSTLINFFLFWDPAPSTGSPRPGLFFNYIAAATFDCTLTISNDLADQTATCFAPVTESRLERTPETVYSDVIVNYAGGKSVYRTMDTTAATFVKRGTSISRPHIGKKATAEAAGDAWLAQHNVETDRITTTIQVSSGHVGLIQAGMRITVKFTNLADYTTPTSMRIVACNPRATDDLAWFYDVDLELVSPQPDVTHPNLLLAILGESTGIGGTPHGARDRSVHAWTKLVDSGSVDADTSHGGQSIGPGTPGMISIWWRWSVPGESGTAVLKFDVLPTGGASVMAAWVYELAGIDAPTSSVSLAVSHVHLGDPANVSMTAASPSVMIAGSAFQKVGYGQVTIIANTDGTILADTNLHNVGGGTCHVTMDGYPPRIYTGYAQGTGTLTFGGTMTCLGATAPEYNLMGWAAIKALFPLTGTFAVVQQAFADDILGGDTTVSLANPPGTSGGTPVTTGGIVPTVNQTQATTNPTVTDDLAAGYLVGSTWINTATGEEFVLVNNTTGAAVWTSTTSTGSWAPTTADYLVGTAQAGLSAEIVVGTTPGGELGGTWASPTVDATHAGSPHLLLGATSTTASAGNHAHAGDELLITDTPAGSPLVFADILQNDAGDALLYSDA